MSKNLATWLEHLGLEQYASVFAENDIDLEILGELTDEDFRELGVSMGHRKRLLRAIGSFGAKPGPEEDRSGAERRQLTIMFCDLVDSTALSVRFDAEDLRAIINAYRSCCEAVVARHHGSIARFMGDGLLVYFGYPQAREHDPERAVRAGIEIISAVNSIDAWPDLKLQTRVGIATGQVVVGDLIGSGRSQEHAVVGETPNLAARLQSLADPDSVVIGSLTRKLVGDLFEYQSLGERTLKGFDAPVESWRVVREVVIESRFDAMHLESRPTRLLGRDTEITKLDEHWAVAAGRKCSAVLISGEAGIGKSRLVYAFRERISTRPHALVSLSCLPFRQNSPLLPVANQLERSAGFRPDDDADTKLDKLGSLIERSITGADQVVPLFASLIGLPYTSRYAEMTDSPLHRRARTMAALAEYIAGLADPGPLLVLVEDVHWIDPTTLELLTQLLNRCAELPVLFLLTARPEFEWSSEPAQVATITLDKLGNDVVEELVLQAAGYKAVPQEVVRQIVDRTDGVPLFVEELTKTLIDSGVLTEQEDRYELDGSLPEFAVPETLQDSLMARLDRMKSGKKVAQVGAAIGRTFSFKLVSAVSDLGEDELRLALDELVDSQLVHSDGAPPDANYVFKHALVQDAAYSSLLKSRRLQIHNQIAEALELYFPDTCRRQPQIPAHHYTQARNPGKAIPRWQSAAQRLIERGNNEEALRIIEHATPMLDELETDRQRSELELVLCVSRGVALESTRGYASPEVEQTYARARELCNELEATFESVPVLLGLYVFHFVRGDLTVARDMANRCVAYAKEARHLEGLIESLAALGFVLIYLGQFEEARRALSDCVQLYESREGGGVFVPITAQDPCVASRAVMSILLWILGDVDGSDRQLESAFALADSLHRPINQSLVHTHAAELYQLRGESEKASIHAGQGLKIATDNGDSYWGMLCAMHGGIAQSIASGSGEGIGEVEAMLSQWQAAGAITNTPYFMMRIAEAQNAGGAKEQSRATIDNAINVARSMNENVFMAALLTSQAELMLDGDSPDTDVAGRSLSRAISISSDQKARMFELRASLRYFELLQSLGRPDEARPGLESAVALFPDGSRLPDITKARELLWRKT